MSNNRFEASSMIYAEQLEDYNGVDIDRLVEEDLKNSMADFLIENFPIDISLGEKVFPNGLSDETHKMTLYVFTPAQLEEYCEDVRREVYYTLASVRAFNLMDTSLCN